MDDGVLPDPDFYDDRSAIFESRTPLTFVSFSARRLLLLMSWPLLLLLSLLLLKKEPPMQ